MFCRCENVCGEPPNTRTCPVCLAHPGRAAGAEPDRRSSGRSSSASRSAAEIAAARDLRTARTTSTRTRRRAYQISQYDEPLCLDGRFAVPGRDGDREVGIVRAHLEEDAAKTIHVGGAAGRIHGAESSLVDFNRGGTPLVEIVTEPDIRSADEARRFLQLLRQTVVELGISDAEMEKGSLRCDANVSVREAGRDGLPHEDRAEEHELVHVRRRRHRGRGRAADRASTSRAARSCRRRCTSTRRPGASRRCARRRRRDDYRYFPEPDLVPVEPPAELIERLRAALPELPGRAHPPARARGGFELAEGLVTSGRDRLYELSPATAGRRERRS